ncbi:hypothetical protein SLE2022_049740 [Rubroshorea leprosula]
MPSQKGSLPENLDDGDDTEYHHLNHGKESRNEDELERAEDEETEQQGQQLKEEQLEEGQDKEQKLVTQLADDKDDDDDDDGDDSDESESSRSEEKPEFVLVELPEIRKDVQCPICLGIIKKTRTVMECLHRFCRECIDKSMRLGNNECPACRTHCASRRSLRDDPNYDALIGALYPDIDKYEEEELAFHEEERTRNKKIQASIAQIFQRQSEALVKRRGKDSTGCFITRSQRNNRSAHLRRRNSRGTDHQGFEDNEDENDNNDEKDSSSSEEQGAEVRQRRHKRRPGTRSSHPASVLNLDGGCAENDVEMSRESRGISPGLVWNPEMLAWGGGGARSHTRHGNSSAGSSKNQRSARLNRLVEYLRTLEDGRLEENNDEVNFHLKLISLDKQNPLMRLQQPYLCCRPNLSVKQLCEYVALQTPLRAADVEILLAKGEDIADDHPSDPPPTSEDKLQILDDQETLAGISVNCAKSRGHLVLAYRQKQTG